MRNTVCTALLSLMGLLCGSEAAAQELVVETNDNAQQLGIDSAALSAEMSSAISSEMHLEEQEDFLGWMANANAMAIKGMGVDYASNPNKFVVGAGIGTGVTAGGVT
jgi:hypothetical protein